ncbi:uncharacterized protein LOC108632146 [Ceratina calcarata]|uniref:Uncharacterized protein LOC108632146 n=1 Tax=Ceratina calcarata TaxID=156304 RepID=A0AAJ7NF20_9HYME|nr:uncharacterized protein LOC108632146 [Ceratina calcarata]
MYYEKCSSTTEREDHEMRNTIDLRSDTMTKPTEEMREAMRNAEVGDDVYEEDPTVKQLEMKAAEMVGMEDALFVSSGTLGNLIAIMNHCNTQGCEVYCGEESYCLHYQAKAAELVGADLRPLNNKSDGTFCLMELEGKLHRARDDEPVNRLVMVENTLNGKVLPLSWLRDLVSLCERFQLKLHMDGARVWNASVTSGIPVPEIVQGCDSVMFCLSKGLGAPVGSLLCGTKEFIVKARRTRKILGGGMRQVGVLAAAGLLALDHVPNLIRDHEKASIIASTIAGLRSKVFFIDLASVQTNMIFVEVRSDVPQANGLFVKRLRKMDEQGVIVKCLALDDSLVRFVFHRDIDERSATLAARKIETVIKELERELSRGN